MKKKFILFISLFLFVIFILQPVCILAHSGRTDSSGGHKDNKNVSGLGNYHYHCGGHEAHLHRNGVCPYSTTSTNAKTTNASTSTSYSTQAKSIEVNSIEFSNSSITIESGISMNLNYKINPDNATNKNVNWKTNNSNVVQIDTNGKITGNSIGSATITATTSNGKTADLVVKVVKYPESISMIDENNSKISIGEKIKLKYSISPNYCSKDVTWTSNNDNIATVSNTGEVTGISAGVATITVRTLNGKYDEIDIKIENIEQTESDFSYFVICIIFLIIISVVIYSFYKNKKHVVK